MPERGYRETAARGRSWGEGRIRGVAEYAAKFNAASPGEEITIDSMAKAIAAYERAIEPGIAPFDRWIEGDEGAISESAKRGFVLFNDKADCFLCHSGWRSLMTVSTISAPRRTIGPRDTQLNRG